MPIIPVPAGQLATIVTCLEMQTRPEPLAPARSALRLVRWFHPVDGNNYRALYRRIGEPWLWSGRVFLDETALDAALAPPTTHVHVATRRDGHPVGLLELDFVVSGHCEIVNFGLVPDLIGKGHGRWLIAHALRLAWIESIERVWLHTSSRDHPHALAFYQACGFVPFERRVEIHPDPRVAGLYRRDTAPHMPLL